MKFICKFLALVCICNYAYAQVTDTELQSLTEELLQLDVFNNAASFITLNLQANGSDSEDNATPNLVNVSPQALRKPTIKRLLRLVDNYNLDAKVTEKFTEQQNEEIDLFVDLIFETEIMSKADAFLKNKGFPNGKANFRKIWFELYKRSSTHAEQSSSGFEHVFVGELTPGIGGMHNWIQFSMEELMNRMEYKGHSNFLEISPYGWIVENSFVWNDVPKPITTIFVGTSPEFEMAVYTICFYAREELDCTISLAGTKFKIITHVQSSGNDKLIATSYADISEMVQPTTPCETCGASAITSFSTFTCLIVVLGFILLP